MIRIKTCGSGHSYPAVAWILLGKTPYVCVLNSYICRFLFERTGHLYKRYRARVAELKRSFDDEKPNSVKLEAGIKMETGVKMEGGLKTEPGTSRASQPGTTCV